MAEAKTQSFGTVIRERRRQLDLTQKEVARRIKTSVPYIGHLESGKRHPSQQVVVKLSDALKLDAVDLFLLANPKVDSLISEQQKADGTPAWTAFVKDVRLRKVSSQHNRPRDGEPLAGSEDGRGTRPTRLHLHPQHHSSGFRSIAVCPTGPAV